MCKMEATTQSLIEKGDFYNAWMSWNEEMGYFLNNMDCGYYYNIALCDFGPAEDNYEEFLNWESSRKALHVGNLDFPNEGNVYFSMINVFMDDGERILSSVWRTTKLLSMMETLTSSATTLVSWT